MLCANHCLIKKKHFKEDPGPVGSQLENCNDNWSLPETKEKAASEKIKTELGLKQHPYGLHSPNEAKASQLINADGRLQWVTD